MLTSALTHIEISNIISNILGIYIVGYIIPLQTVGLFLLVIGLSIIIIDRIRNYREQTSQNIITGLLFLIEIVSLIHLSINIKNVILPLMNFSDLLKKEGFTSGTTLIPFENFFHISFFGSTLWGVLWIVTILFFLVFHFYLIWQKNVSTIGKFFILSGYFFIFISAGILICLMSFNLVGQFIGIKFW